MESAKELAEGKESVRVLDEYTYDDLGRITNGFNTEYFIGETQFGKLFRGKVERGFETEDVIVKISTAEPFKKNILESVFTRLRMLSRLENEKRFLTDEKFCNHQNLVKLIGYCIGTDHLGTVYHLNPRDTLHNLIPQDGFKWTCRIKVALQFARLLEFLNYQKIKIRNIDARHIMVDQAFNLKLLDFGKIAGGVFGHTSMEMAEWLPSGYADPNLCMTGSDSGCDLYAYGLILLALISKRAVLNQEDKWLMHNYLDNVGAWAHHEYERREGPDKSLVHVSLEAHPFYYTSDGVELTRLAMWCVEENWKKRPTIHEVVSRLRGLNVVQRCRLLDIPLVDGKGV